jgi:hypothetical protein
MLQIQMIKTFAVSMFIEFDRLKHLSIYNLSRISRKSNSLFVKILLRLNIFSVLGSNVPECV